MTRTAIRTESAASAMARLGDGPPEATQFSAEEARRPPSPDDLVALAIAAGNEDPAPAAQRLLAAAGGTRERLERAHLILVERLRGRSNDFEATGALRIVERALDNAPYPDGLWRWQRELDPRRMRAARRRRARALRRGRLPERLHAAADRVVGKTAGSAGVRRWGRRVPLFSSRLRSTSSSGSGAKLQRRLARGV